MASRARGIVAVVGVTTLLAAALRVAWLALGDTTMGNDAREASVLLLLPAAFLLAAWLFPRSPALVLTGTLCGVLALAFFALSVLPWAALALAGAWWLGLAWSFLLERSALGTLTLALGVAAVADAAAMVLSARLPALAALVAARVELALELAWMAWLAVDLLRQARGRGHPAF